MLTFADMEWGLLIFCLFWVHTWINAEYYKLPDYIRVCYRDDPRTAECLKKEIERLMPIFKSGAKEFDLQPLDPLEFTNITFKFKNSIIGGVATIKKASVFGLADTKILAVRPKVQNSNKWVVDFDMHLDKGVIETRYKLAGNVDALPVSMEGNLNMELADINLRYHVAADIKTINGREFLYLNSFKGRFIGDSPKGFRLLNDDVVIGKPALNTLVRTIIKVSWTILKNAMMPTLLVESDRFLENVFLEFFKKYPYDVIFPKNKPKYNE